MNNRKSFVKKLFSMKVGMTPAHCGCSGKSLMKRKSFGTGERWKIFTFATCCYQTIFNLLEQFMLSHYWLWNLMANPLSNIPTRPFTFDSSRLAVNKISILLNESWRNCFFLLPHPVSREKEEENKLFLSPYRHVGKVNSHPRCAFRFRRFRFLSQFSAAS